LIPKLNRRSSRKFVGTRPSLAVCYQQTLDYQGFEMFMRCLTANLVAFGDFTG
jgi:hypothetical protein